jgi:hypothetical protein
LARATDLAISTRRQPWPQRIHVTHRGVMGLGGI